MFNYLLTLALMLYVIPMQTHAQAHKAQQTSESDKPTSPIASITPQNNGGPGYQGERNEHVGADVRIISTPAKDHYDKAAVWVNVVLGVVGTIGVMIGVCTLVLIKRQAGEMRLQRVVMEDTLTAINRQADMMDQQIGISKAGMRQWIELGEWKSMLPVGSRENIIEISFQISNPTNLLLTTEFGQISFTNPHMTVIFIYRSAPLGPDNPQKVKLNIPLTEERTSTLFVRQSIGFSVSGFVTYRNAFEERVTQCFDGIISCSQRETTFEATVRAENGGGNDS